ncbi:MAG: CoA-binding protein [Spirochaetota bacterium]
MSANERVAVIGASSKPERYSYKVVKLLKEHDHTPLPISIKDQEILGEKTYASISDVPEPIDTVTVYVNPTILSKMKDEVVAKQPKRLIMNPGTESEDLKSYFESKGIHVVQNCSLVLLNKGQFESA